MAEWKTDMGDLIWGQSSSATSIKSTSSLPSLSWCCRNRRVNSTSTGCPIWSARSLSRRGYPRTIKWNLHQLMLWSKQILNLLRVRANTTLPSTSSTWRGNGLPSLRSRSIPSSSTLCTYSVLVTTVSGRSGVFKLLGGSIPRSVNLILAACNLSKRWFVRSIWCNAL